MQMLRVCTANHNFLQDFCGEIVDREWKRTFAIRPDMNLWMDEFVVMPNHFHAIIGIGVKKI